MRMATPAAISSVQSLADPYVGQQDSHAAAPLLHELRLVKAHRLAVQQRSNEGRRLSGIGQQEI